jgi:hypothetical protein
MAIKRTEYTSSFRVTDAHGSSHTLHIFTDILDAGDPGDPHAEVAGTISLRTDDKQGVDRHRKGEYRTRSGETLRSDDPDAP